MREVHEHFAGAARVLTPADGIERFRHPARGADGSVLAVVQPATVDEARGVVRIAVTERIRLVPQGANTGLVGASVPPPEEPAVVLSLDLLAGPPVVDPDNASAVVGAGTRLSALNEAAARHGLSLPIDLAADPAIGGMIATNTGGARVLRYGAMRHHVLGVEVVTADEDASVIGAPTALRKDSRGLAATEVAVGSGGALGVITRAAVALTPLPRTRQTWWLALADAADAITLYALLEAVRPGGLSAFELLSGPALARTLAGEGAPANPFGSTIPPAAVLAEWSFGHDPGDEGVSGDIERAFDRGLITDGRLADGDAAWAVRHRVAEILSKFGVVSGHDVSAPRGALMAVRSAAAAAVAELAPHAELCDFGHVGDGGLHLTVLFPAESGPPAPGMTGAVRQRFDEIVAAHGGSYSAEHGLGPLNAQRWLDTTAPVTKRLIAAMKAVTDPARLLGHPGHPYNRL